MSANLENSAVFTQDWKRSVFISIPKKGNAKNAQTTVQLHSSHTLEENPMVEEPGRLQSMRSLRVGHD